MAKQTCSGMNLDHSMESPVAPRAKIDFPWILVRQGVSGTKWRKFVSSLPSEYANEILVGSDQLVGRRVVLLLTAAGRESPD
jgi:hypothetical protein